METRLPFHVTMKQKQQIDDIHLGKRFVNKN